jgi:electron transfer flavoprotein beta subunit
VGPDRVSQAIKTALAMGADRAIHINDPEAEGADPLGVARMLQATVAADSFDLVLAGLQTEDDNSAQLGPMLARLLDLPCATGVTALTLADDGKSVRVERELENNRRQVVDLDLPAVVTVQTGINQPRYASLKGIMAAKRKETRVVKLSDLGLTAEQAGGAAARMRILQMAPPPKGEGAELVEGSADEVAAELVRRIKEKTGVI